MSFFRTVDYKETGVRHIKKGKGCEDSVFHTVCNRTGVTVVALSDGAGSCKNAAIGSEITAKIAAETLAPNFEQLYHHKGEAIAGFVLDEVHRALARRSLEDGEDIMSYSATLLCVAMHPDGRYIAFHVGDGAIVGYNQNNECQLISIYQHDGPVNLTTFVTVDNTEYHFKKGKGNFYAFILMSDGPEPFLVNEVKISPRTKLMAQLSFFLSEESMQEQLASMVALFNRNGMDDDASFAIIQDTRKTSEVYNSLSPELKKMFSDVDETITNRRILRKIYKIIDIVSTYPRGISIRHLSRKMHIKYRYFKRKKYIQKLKFIECKNGKLYIS